MSPVLGHHLHLYSMEESNVGMSLVHQDFVLGLSTVHTHLAPSLLCFCTLEDNEIRRKSRILCMLNFQDPTPSSF